jgi:hypothetical protein
MRTHAAALALVSLCVFAGSASAAKIGTVDGIKYVGGQADLPSAGAIPKSAELQVRCGPGWKSTGGGARVTGGPAHTFLASSAHPTNRVWYGESWHQENSAARMDVFAVCWKDPTFVPGDASVGSVPAGPSSTNHSITCDAGQSIVGGGVLAIGTDTDFAINATYPVGTDTWRAYVDHPTGPSGSILVYATCKSGTPPVYRQKTSAGFGAGSSGTITAKCPKGTHVLAGGAYTSGAVSEAAVLATIPADLKDKDKIPDDGWTARAYNAVGGQKVVTAYATCI